MQIQFKAIIFIISIATLSTNLNANFLGDFFEKASDEVSSTAVATVTMTSEAFEKAKETLTNAATSISDFGKEAATELAAIPFQIYLNWHMQQKSQIEAMIKTQYQTAGSIRKSTSISSGEEAFNKKRSVVTQKAFSTLFGDQISLAAPSFKLAFVGTGGGYRATILTAGYMLALEELGLINALHSCSTLSGSTWFLAPWIEHYNTINEYVNKTLKAKFKSGEADLNKFYNKVSDFEIMRFLNKTIDPKLIFNQTISLVDPYGDLIARAFLDDLGEKQHEFTLPSQIKNIQEGTMPLPLYTSISIHKTDDLKAIYNWYEFNPFEITNLNLSLSFPSYTWGWKFNEGKTIDYEPIEKLSTFMGLFGSAFAVNILDLEQQNKLLKIYTDAYKNSSGVEAIFALIKLNALKAAIDTPTLNSLRASALQIKNPFYNFPATIQKLSPWLLERDLLTFVDAGIDYNIPLKPAVRPERGTNFVIIGEASSNAATGEELNKALEDLKKSYGYTYTFVSQESTESMRIYRDTFNKNAPVIVYFNFLPNKSLSKKIDASAQLLKLANDANYKIFEKDGCLENYCNTFNFSYSEQQFEQLKSAAMLAILAHKQELLQLIKNEIEATKNKKV